MMDKHVQTKPMVIRVVVRFLLPFIFMYGLYIQLHGEYSPGGGFQAGVICAVMFMIYGLVYGLSELQNALPLWILRILSAVGVLIYGLVGIVTMMKGGVFLEYGVLVSDPVKGQQIGIMLIELGVGVTVFAVMLIVYYMFSERLRKP